jgi:DNA-binding NarL/FixJ family response regulator
LTLGYSTVVSVDGSFLIVEDDEAVSAAVRRTFDRFRPTHAVSTLSAAREFFATSPRCCGLVVDLGLPDGSGLSLVAEVRAHAPKLPVLILTGTVQADLINAAFALRADYLCKPGSRDDFVAFIRRALLSGVDGRKKVDVMIEELVVTHSLSQPEAAILRKVAKDHPRGTLAQELGVNENTLKTQIRTLLRKCNATTLDDLLRQVLRRAIDS